MLTKNDLEGTGNWRLLARPVEEYYRAAEEWRAAIGNVTRPWLVWHVSDRWTRLQERLIQSVGWTPVIGQDPRAARPRVLPGSIYIDFDARFHFPTMRPHVPLEFAFLWVPDRLAFWHSDLLCRKEAMHRIAQIFEELEQGEMSAVFSTGGRRNLVRPWKFRYWELITCTTREASRRQFDVGSGWWRHFSLHPNRRGALEKYIRKAFHWDHGGGVFYWKIRYGGKVISIPESWVAEGHCTSIGRSDYKLVHGSRAAKDLRSELDMNYDIEEVATRLGIADLLEPAPAHPDSAA